MIHLHIIYVPVDCMLSYDMLYVYLYIKTVLYFFSRFGMSLYSKKHHQLNF